VSREQAATVTAKAANPGGFYNPFARSVSEKSAPNREHASPAVPRTEKPKDGGGFYNPAARPGSGH
jgi:hypothetical protein